MIPQSRGITSALMSKPRASGDDPEVYERAYAEAQ